ncbi:hypothetical protein Tco_0949056 [Tanacetum coccineum]
MLQRAGDELEKKKAKKQKGDDDQEEEEMKKHMEIVQDDEVAIDTIPLATKPPMIVEYKIDKEGKKGYFNLIRADGSLKRYSSMIQMLQGIDRGDLETLWKLVKAKHGLRRPEEDYERVLWGDLVTPRMRERPLGRDQMSPDFNECRANHARWFTPYPRKRMTNGTTPIVFKRDARGSLPLSKQWVSQQAAALS